MSGLYSRNKGEVWLPLGDLAPDYEVSNRGRVRRRVAFRQWPAKHIMALRRSPSGYLGIVLRVNKRNRAFNVSRLVCYAFHGPPPGEGYHAAHRDGDKDNNTPENLRWATPKENGADKLRHGTPARGERQHLAKLNEGVVREIRAAPDRTLADLAAQYGVSYQTIGRVRNKETWRHV